jgi:hypothetical protein
MDFLKNIQTNVSNTVNNLIKPKSETFGAFVETEDTDSSPASIDSFSVTPNYNSYATDLKGKIGNDGNPENPGYYYPWNYPTYSYPYYIPYYSEYPTVSVQGHQQEVINQPILIDNAANNCVSTKVLLFLLIALIMYMIYKNKY